MSKDWERAILSKAEELLYKEIIGENEYSSEQSQFYFILLYFTMRMKHQNEEATSMIDEGLMKLLHEMKEFQGVQEKSLRDLDSMVVGDDSES